MPHKHNHRPAPIHWLALLFRQPPPGFYHKPAIYLSGGRMEIEHFQTILAYDETRLCVQLPKGRFTVRGDALRIHTLTASRITLYGTFLQTDFSDD